MSLQFENINFRYGQSTQGIDQLNIDVGSGELLAVIGASGSGKSTLLRLVSGLLEQQSGRIVLDGKDLSGLPVHHRNIGMVFQNYALFPHLDLIGNVSYGLKMRGMAPVKQVIRAKEMLGMVGLEHLARRMPRQLSGGQQQRVALARALAYGPSALLLDEPLSALDASIRGHLRDQIKHLQRDFNATTLFVTHDQEEALAIADRVAVMEQGKLLQIATPQELYTHPISRTVAQFVGHSTIFHGRVAAHNLVDIGFMQLSVNTDARLVGKEVWALIRPEHVIATPSDDSINCIDGRLGDVRYLGAIQRYDFFPLGSKTPILGEARQPPENKIAIRPEDIHLLDT